VSGSGIRWAVSKSAPRYRQTTTPAPHHSVFSGRMLFLPPSQQRPSTEGMYRIQLGKGKGKRSIAVRKKPRRYGNSRAIWDHTVLPATRQR